jgi:hypothetical protein
VLQSAEAAGLDFPRQRENKSGTNNQGRIAATNGETPAAVLPQMTKQSRK